MSRPSTLPLTGPSMARCGTVVRLLDQAQPFESPCTFIKPIASLAAENMLAKTSPITPYWSRCNGLTDMPTSRMTHARAVGMTAAIPAADMFQICVEPAGDRAPVFRH